MKSTIFILSLFSLTLAYIQPTTLCGYSPIGYVIKQDPENIIKIENQKDDQIWFYTSRLIINVSAAANSGCMQILFLLTYGDVYVNEFGLELPCSAKSLFELLGLPGEVSDQAYQYSYDIGEYHYLLYLYKSKENADNIDGISLSASASVTYYKDWLKRTKAYISKKN